MPIVPFCLLRSGCLARLSGQSGLGRCKLVMAMALVCVWVLLVWHLTQALQTGLSTMHAAVEACERFGTKHSKSNYHDNLERNLQVTILRVEFRTRLPPIGSGIYCLCFPHLVAQMVRTLANRGASVLQKSLPFSGHTAQMRFGVNAAALCTLIFVCRLPLLLYCGWHVCDMQGAGLQKMIAEGHALNAAQACRYGIQMPSSNAPYRIRCSHRQNGKSTCPDRCDDLAARGNRYMQSLATASCMWRPCNIHRLAHLLGSHGMA